MTQAVSLPRIGTELTMNLAVAETISQALKEAQPIARRYHKQLDQALAYLRAGHSYELRGASLRCQSQTSPNIYDVTIDACDCPGRYHQGTCFHPALLSLLLAYQTLTAAATAVVAMPHVQPTPLVTTRRRAVSEPVWTPTPRTTAISDAEYADILAQADELF